MTSEQTGKKIKNQYLQYPETVALQVQLSTETQWKYCSVAKAMQEQSPCKGHYMMGIWHPVYQQSSEQAALMGKDRLGRELQPI